MHLSKASATILFFTCLAPCTFAQSSSSPLDPAQNVTHPVLESSIHQPLPEQFIWTAADSGHAAAPRYFRRAFQLDSLPIAATLYIAGPRSAQVFVNGKLVEHVELPKRTGVFAQDVTAALKVGSNVIAIEAVYRRALIVKLVPAARGVNAPALVISDGQWKGSLADAPDWQSAGFDDASWQPVTALGSIEGSIDLFQWNSDAGLYDWPGYDGISPFLAHLTLAPVLATSVYFGAGEFHNLDSLTAKQPAAGEFAVQLPSDQVEDTYAPQLLLDFGREVSGRLRLVSDSDQPAKVTVQYGESEPETLNDPYLGVNPLYIPPHGAGYGPKSAFRYALVRFTGDGENLRFKAIDVDAIFYPVKYQGFFQSSDPGLNRIWAIGAYTAHLCMQDDIWDAPKRDRGRWMGDLDVSGRTIDDVFADRFLMEDTLNRLMGPAPIDHHVNNIAGYSAAWITGEAEYYRHIGSGQQLASFHDRLVQLMHYMEKELDGGNLYANQTHSWPFVDWSPELNGDTPEARRATQFEFYGAFRQGVYLLNQMGDTANARLFQQRADQLKAAAQRYLLDKSTNSFGTRWQTNAAAVLSGVANPSQYASVWKASLSSVGKVRYNGLIITPYYNYYVISAMAEMGHRAQALDWIRQYWGGMVKEGATSFWEGYDPDWYKGNFHASLQADNGSGYYVSLAHGWSSGVTPWLMEQILGIHSTGAGFFTVDIRPDLIDLQWAKGGEPTPRGMLDVSIKQSVSGMDVSIDLPPGTEARVSVPLTRAGHRVFVNGKQEPGTAAEHGRRAIVVLKEGGHFEISTR